MKRFLKSLTLTLASIFVLTAVASATPSNGWRVNISSPANTTSKNFKIQYTSLSISVDDAITVELFENGDSKGRQTTTKAYGDSGDFDISVPLTGTYEYYVQATNTGGEALKTTTSVSVSVTEQPQASINQTNVGSTDEDGASMATSAGNQDGKVNATETGQIGDDPIASEGNAVGETAKKNQRNKLGWILVALVGFAVVGYAAYTYWWLPRHNQV